jgi:RHS repeat-associated protein
MVGSRVMLRGLVGCLAVLSGLWGGAAWGQYCPGGTTYFGANYFAGCTVGSCWSGVAFAGSTAVSGSYPAGNYACASATIPTSARENTLYGYDGNGNLLTVVNPLGYSTSNTYDGLNRLIQVVDPASGTTGYTYNAAGQLTQVSDPRSLATGYGYDGLGNATQLVSPDTGTASSTFDAAGNVLTRTDARGVTASYSYDGINRVTQVVYAKAGTASETHGFTYDTGSNGKGRLTQLVDSAGTTAWSYTAQGRVSSKTQVVGVLSRTVGYSYNAAGQLAGMTTPSGQQVVFGYSNNRVSSITVNGTPVISATMTEPFAGISLWHWGNGLYSYRTHDDDGRIAGWEFRNGTSVLRNDLGFDYAGRITSISDPANATLGGVYQYDSLDRLTQAQQGSPVVHTQQLSYDAVGNRRSVGVDTTSSDLLYDGASNRLQSMNGTAVPAGYLNGATALTFTYNNANRLVAVQSSGVAIASYAVNGLGQRVQKVAGGATTQFVYDEQGRLIGEYDGTGALIQETVWLEDLPVATLRPTGPGNPPPIAIYYVHADHLGTPRAVTRPSDNALVWRWDNVDPFGANAANENPAGLGTFKQNLRFPGQYYDVETASHYNYFRDYDPTIGRYIQSDPIGFNGDLNAYAFGRDDPVGNVDRFGLQAELGVPERPIRIPGFPNPIDVFFPGTPSNDAFVSSTLTMWKAIKGALCPDDCELAKAEAKSSYDRLMKRIREYITGGGRGPDKRHWQSISQAQANLQDALRKVRLYCKELPPEMAEWEQAANTPIPPIH